MYQLKTVADFESAHFLSGYQGKCANIHGHRWHVEIEIQAEYLEMQGQMRGMLVDFGDLKRDLKKLADAGVIEIGAGKGRAITLTHPAAPSVPEPEEPADRVPIVGNVAAGSPILAQECIEDYLTFHTGHPGDVHFALRVRGESMLNAGILPGDLVVVRQQQTCNQGEIVVAMIDDEATVKRFSRKNGHIWLLPENDDYEPIDGTYAQILGKVVAVVRQY